MKILAYIVDTYNDKPGLGGFSVKFGVSDATYSSSETYYVPIGTEDAIRQALQAEVADSVNAALGTSLTAADVRLF